jgi:hypothetical protein
VGFVVDKVAVGQVFSEYFGFICPHFTDCSILIHYPGWYKGSISGLRTKWTQSHPTYGIIRMIIMSRELRLAGQVTSMGEK